MEVLENQLVLPVDSQTIENFQGRHLSYVSPLKSSYFHPMKRIIDLSLIILSLPLHIPIAIIVGLMIKLSSKGPILFKQKRIGLFGNEFVCFKFRTMVTGADRLRQGDGTAPTVTKQADKRITIVGKFLRRTNLDELPQLWNVLIGDMSLVGPRPYYTEEHFYWVKHLPGFNTRTLVKPGVSGLAQVSGFRGGTLDLSSMSKRFEKDLTYIRKFSIKLDLLIVWWTIKQMITGKTGAH